MATRVYALQSQLPPRARPVEGHRAQPEREIAQHVQGRDDLDHGQVGDRGERMRSGGKRTRSSVQPVEKSARSPRRQCCANPKKSSGCAALTCSQNARSSSTRLCGALPAMLPARTGGRRKLAVAQNRVIAAVALPEAHAAAVNSVKLVARVQGYVQEINYQDGAAVKKGTPLFVIEPEPYKVKLEQGAGGGGGRQVCAGREQSPYPDRAGAADCALGQERHPDR
jgi:acetyl/propionyl-CoA carboxylase alpha subunit